MDRREGLAVAAYLAASPADDLTGVPVHELMERLRGVVRRRDALTAERVEAVAEGVQVIGALRALGVGYEAIRDQAGVTLGTAHRWMRLHQPARRGTSE